MSQPDQASESKPVGSEMQEMQSGAEYQHWLFPWRSALVVGTVALIIGFFFWYMGQASRSNLSWWPHVTFGSDGHTVDVLDSRLDRVLLLESSNGQNRVLVEDTNSSSWLLVSLDDYTASVPALSPDGKIVAYRSSAGEGRISVVFLDEAKRLGVSTADLNAVDSSLIVCPWTPIAWSPSSQRISFYVCSPRKGASMLVWTETSAINPTVIPTTDGPINIPRQVQWLNESQVIATTSLAGDTGGVQIKTYPVQ